MIQAYPEIRDSVRTLNKLLRDGKKQGFAQVQKILSTPHFICMRVRIPGKTLFLYLGRGSGYEGLWIGERPPAPPYRVQDLYLEYLRKHLSGGYFESVDIDENDRIIFIPTQVGDLAQCFAFFFKGRQLHFIHVSRKGDLSHVFKSWEYIPKSERELRVEDVRNFILEAFRPLGLREQSGREKAKKTYKIEDYLEDLPKTFSGQKVAKRKKKAIERKYQNISRDLHKNTIWKDLLVELEEERLDLSGRELIFQSIKVKFSRDDSVYKKRDKIYQKIKRLKRGESIQEKRLASVLEELRKLEKEGQRDRYQNVPKILRPIWSSISSRKGRLKQVDSKNSPIKEVTLKSGQKFAVGTNTSSNDYLRNVWAKKDDIWFHVDGHKGAHIILKNSSGLILSADLLEVIASALRDYSKLEIIEIPVVYTQVKFVKGLKGRAGAVTYKRSEGGIFGIKGPGGIIFYPDRA